MGERAELTVRALLFSGHAVVVDATNTTRKRQAPWHGISRDLDVPLDAFVFHSPAAECHERNLSSGDPGPPDVIDRMNEQCQPVTEDAVTTPAMDAER